MRTTGSPFRQAEDLPPRGEMLRALAERDASYEGIFYLGVRTTGVFCRPACPAKTPRPENVEFFASTREALTAGYRPCRRCRPMVPAGAAPAWLERLLRQIDEDPARRWKDADLRAEGLDPARVRRWFKRQHGMTFHAYQRSRRLGLALGRIRRGDELMDTALTHGFESLSGFRDAFSHLFGEPPGRGRSGHAVMTRVLTPLGPLLAGATNEGLCMLEFADRRMLETQIERLRRHVGGAITPGSNGHVEQVERELAEYFDGERTAFEVPLVARGTEFQELVWAALREIPFGETRSYEDVARAIGRPKAVRAVGRANGDNRIPIVIPCHRVVRADGTLGGYGGELWRKRFLLRLEGHARYGETQHALPMEEARPSHGSRPGR